MTPSPNRHPGDKLTWSGVLGPARSGSRQETCTSEPWTVAYRAASPGPRRQLWFLARLPRDQRSPPGALLGTHPGSSDPPILRKAARCCLNVLTVYLLRPDCLDPAVPLICRFSISSERMSLTILTHAGLRVIIMERGCTPHPHDRIRVRATRLSPSTIIITQSAAIWQSMI